VPSRLRSLLARPAAVLLIPLLLATAAYWRVLDGEFQFDDTHTVERHLAVKDLGAFLRNNFVAEYGQRPVTDLTFAFNYAVGGLEPWNYHLTNLVIHLAAAVLVWAFTRAVLRLAGAARAEWVAVAVAGIFALHPIQSQAVSYISQRAESLGSALYVATLLVLLAAERRGLTARGAPLWAAAFACFVVALGAKAIAVTLPVAWLLLAAVVPAPERRAEILPWRHRALAVLPFLAFDAFFAARAMGMNAGSAHAGFSVPGLPPWTYFMTQLRVVVVYLRLLFWPAGQNVDWDFPISRSLAETGVVLSGLFLLALAGGAVAAALVARRRSGPGAGAARVAAYGVLWFFVALSVTSSFVPLADVIVEHRVYLACWGIFAAVAVGVERALAFVPPPRALAAAAAVLAVTWAAPAAALYRRNAVWETRRALWTDSVEKSPLKGRVHLSLGYAALQEGKLEESVQMNSVALKLVGNDLGLELQILRNLGAGYVLLGRLDEAESVLRAAAAKGHWDADVLNNLAVTLAAKRNLDEAETFAKRATMAQPERGEGWNTLGEIKLRRGKAVEALQLFEHSIQLDPDIPARHFNRGLALAALGRVAEACALWATLVPGNDTGLRINMKNAWRENRCEAMR